MSRFAIRNLSLLLMLAAFPLISIGTTAGQPIVWGLGLASLGIGALFPPVLRFLPSKAAGHEARKPPTDLGDSGRVC